MRIVLPLAVAGALGLMAWPIVDAPSAPALEFVDSHRDHWPGQSLLKARQATWVGNENKRDAILMSAVWTSHK